MDPLLLARLQFALTVGFHFLFPPLTIGLAWMLVIIEAIGWKKKDEVYAKIGKFFGKVLGLIFAVGVASGIVMEFQFGTNWSEYSKFVGDIFGAPLAAEGVFAFFLESTFLGLYILGRERVSKGVHWFSILMVAIGSTISAFWILVANSWQQTPAGYILQNNRAELVDFWAAVFNPSTLPRFFHTLGASMISGAFLMMGISAYWLIKKINFEIAIRSMRFAVIFGLIFSILEVFPFGHEHAKQVARTQPEKFAAIQGLYTNQEGAPLAIFAIPGTEPPKLHFPIEIPGLLSWLAFGDINAKIKGINEFPQDEIPPLLLTFVSYHNMVLLGIYFIFITILSFYLMRKNKLFENQKILKVLMYSTPLPLIASQLGWISAEVGRQPWIVYKLMKTKDAVSVTVGTGELIFSILMFIVIYILLLSIFLKLLFNWVKKGPEKIKVEVAQ